MNIGAVREVGRVDVVPRAHRDAVVDRHRPYRRMRKHEPDRQRLWKLHFLDDRHKIVAVGAEAVQPHDRRIGVRAGFELDAGKKRGHGAKK